MSRSRSVRRVLAVAGTAAVLAAGMAVPAGAASAGPGLFGFGDNEWGQLPCSRARSWAGV